MLQGETLPLSLDVRDADNDEVRLWFPKSPPGWRFQPDAREGTWTVPEDFEAKWWAVIVLAEDSGDPAGATTLYVSWVLDGGDVQPEDTGL